MATFYERMAALATRILSGDKGKVFTFTHETKGTYDPVTGQYVGSTSAPYTTNGAIIPWESATRWGFLEKQNTAIQEGDLRMITDAANFSINDTVTIDSQVYRIHELDPIKPADTPVAYWIHLTR